MIKIYKYNKLLQDEVESFIKSNIKKEITNIDKKSLIHITKDLEDIDKNYIANGGELLLAYDVKENKIVGTIAITYENEVCMLKRFYVDKDYRSQKIGLILYAELDKVIKEKHIEKIYLTSGNNLENAHKFYEKNGWEESKENPGIFLRKGAKLFTKEVKEEEIVSTTKDVLKQAEILIEAIPYIKEYVGKIMVLKYGGNAMIDVSQKENIAKQVALLKMLGIKVVLVHGGGPDIKDELDAKNIESKFIDGLRVTDKNTMDVVKNVLIGKTNADMVNLLNVEDCKAIGISGLDSKMLGCEKLNEELGFVGKIVNINEKVITDLLEKDYTPVIAPIGTDNFGNSYNINADTAASQIAIKLNAKKIIFLTNIDGVLDEDKKIISIIHKEKIDELIEKGIISGGMIPKIKACENCLNSGVEKTHILNGTVKNTILYEILSDNGIGTMII